MTGPLKSGAPTVGYLHPLDGVPPVLRLSIQIASIASRDKVFPEGKLHQHDYLRRRLASPGLMPNCLRNAAAKWLMFV